MKKLNWFLIFMLIFCYLAAWCQHSFTFEYEDAYANQAFDLMETTDGSFIILSGRFDYFGPNFQNTKLLKISAQGELMLISEIFIPGAISELSKLHRYPGVSDEFMAVGTITPGNNPNQSFIHIVHFDKRLKQIAQYQTRFPLNTKIEIHKSVIDSYGNIIVSGSYVDGLSAWSLSIFIARVSLLGKIIDFNTLPLPGHQFVNDIIQPKSTALQYGITVTGLIPGSFSIESLLVFDSLLNYQCVYPIPFISGFGNVTVVNYEQSGYIFSGKKDSNIQLDPNAIRYGFGNVIDMFLSTENTTPIRKDYAVVKTDFDLNILQTAVFGLGNNMVDFPAHNRATNYLNSSFIFNAGTINIKPGDYPFQLEPSWILINKLGADLGLIWQRYYGGDAYYHATNINATSDGGCIVSGFKFDYNTNDFNYNLFVIKTSPDGVLTTIDNPGGIQEREVILYPNPGTTLLNIQTGYENLYIKFFDTRGILRYEEKVKQFHHVINTTGWPVGVYLYQIIKGMDILESGKWVKGE